MFIIAKTIQSDLGELADKNERILLLALRDWMAIVVQQIQSDLRTKYAKSIASELTDWEMIEEYGKNAMKPATLKVMQKGGNAAFKSLAISGSFDVLNVQAVKAADKFVAKLVTNVTKETKAGIRNFISTGIKEGKSMPKIARELRPIVGLTKPQVQSVANYRKLLGDKEKFPKLTAGDVDRKVQRYTDKTHRRRMDTIARTETAHAQNIGYVQGLAENGVTEFEFESELDACPECTALKGDKFPAEEAQDIIPVHPRCRCAMLPVIGEKTVGDKGKYDRDELPATMQAPEGLPAWKKYNAMHPEQTSQESLYDWYKLKYETDGKLAPSAARFLKTNANRFEAKSVKIMKPVPGVSTTTITPAEVRVLPKPKPEGVLPESYFNETKGWEERLVSHKASLQERIGVDFKALKTQRTDLPEYKEALAKFESAMKSGATSKKIPSATRKPTYNGLAAKKPAATKNLNAYYDRLEEVGSDDLIRHYENQKISITTHTGNFRAKADSRWFDIDMATSDQVKIYFHELGHLMEHNSNIAVKAKAWIRARGGGIGKSVPYNKIASWSKDTQMAYKDKFIDPYVGKYYRSGHTEAISMGMQQFTSYSQMMRFAKKDFDHFAFIHGILTGAI